MNDASHPVVVGFDGSDDSRNAVEYAATMAGDLGCPLRIIRCYAWAEPQAPVAEAAARELAAVHRALTRRRPDLTVQTESMSWSPAAALIEASGSAAMVVVGYRGAGTYGGVHTSVVSRQLANLASCPTVVTRGAPRRGERIVVCAGMDGGSTDTLRFAFAEASRRQIGLRAVRLPVARLPEVGLGAVRLPAVELPAVDASGASQDDTADGDDELTRWCGKYPDVEVERRTLPPWDAAPRLLAAAADAELLVVEVPRSNGRGPGGLGNGLDRSNRLGAVPSALLAADGCPMAIIGREAWNATGQIG
jgi:nucleotide-binding universal stress UspA family protein